MTPALDFDNGITFQSNLQSWYSTDNDPNWGNTVQNAAKIWFQPKSYKELPGASSGWHGILNFGCGREDGTPPAYTENTPRMSINSIGNVGIGTTTPLSKLAVYGNAVIGASYAGTTVAPSNGLVVEGKVSVGSLSTIDNYMFYVNGAMQATSYNATSDIRHKENVCDLENAVKCLKITLLPASEFGAIVIVGWFII